MATVTMLDTVERGVTVLGAEAAAYKEAPEWAIFHAIQKKDKDGTPLRVRMVAKLRKGQAYGDLPKDLAEAVLSFGYAKK